MRFAGRFTPLVLQSLTRLQCPAPAECSDDVILGDWENSGPNGHGGPGSDFDPAPVDAQPTCTGCWLNGSQTAVTTLSQSTVGATHGSHSLRIDMVGRGNGGGDGLQDTHFDLGARAVWSITQNDSRALALRDAIDGGLPHLVEFDVTYDIPALRSLDWLGPPVGFPDTPEQFVGVSLYGNTNNDGGEFSFPAFADELGTQINLFDPQFDATTYVTRHAVVRLDRFNFTPDPIPPPTYYEIGLVINGNWGTNPAAENTQAAAFYVDHLLLNRIGDCFSLVGDCDLDLDDWALFMSQHLVPNPSVGDFDADGDKDFQDLMHFQQLYDLAHDGPESSTSVLEPTTLWLLVVAGWATGAGFPRPESTIGYSSGGRRAATCRIAAERKNVFWRGRRRINLSTFLGNSATGKFLQLTSFVRGFALSSCSSALAAFGGVSYRFRTEYRYVPR